MLYRNKASMNKLIEKNMLLEESQHLKATEEYITKSLISIVKNNISFSSWLEKVEVMEISINLYQTLSGNEILITVRVKGFWWKGMNHAWCRSSGNTFSAWRWIEISSGKYNVSIWGQPNKPINSQSRVTWQKTYDIYKALVNRVK